MILFLILWNSMSWAGAGVDANCNEIFLQAVQGSNEAFLKARPTIEGRVNSIFSLKGIKPFAAITPSTLISENFQNLYVQYATAVKSADPGAPKILMSMVNEGRKVKADFFKQCTAKIGEMFKLCKLSEDAQSATPVQQQCVNARTPEMAMPLFKMVMDGRMGNQDKYNEVMDKLHNQMMKKASDKVLMDLLEQRIASNCHMLAAIPEFVEMAVTTNHVGALGTVRDIMKQKDFAPALKSGFEKKDTLLRQALKHKDQAYFKLLAQGNFFGLTDAEKNKLAEDHGIKDKKAFLAQFN